VATIGKILSQYPELSLKLLLIGFHDQTQKRNFLAKLSAHEKKALDVRRVLLFQKDLNPFYKASDAFVLNSQGLGENFGRVTTEAMAFGLPVLATNAGGTPEIVINKITGLLHPVGEPGQDDLAQNIHFLINNPEKAKAFGAAGRLRVKENFNDQIFYLKLTQVFQKILVGMIFCFVEDHMLLSLPS
jgi:glycosyltransferase involved in cell wall biosynthesis